MSKEHVIADWIQRLMPHAVQYHSTTQIRFERAPGRTLIAPIPPRNRQGSIGNRKLRRVCRICNNGWMKNIQDETKPVLQPLLQGVWEILGPDVALILARWATMTAMNIDAVDDTGGGVPDSERKTFQEKRNPPENWNVWMGRCTGGDAYKVHHIGGKTHRAGLPMPEDQTKDSQITTIKIGQLVFHTLSVAPGMWNPDTNFQYGKIFGIVPIFPVWGGDMLDWRFAPILDMTDLLRLETGFTNEMLRRGL